MKQLKIIIYPVDHHWTAGVSRPTVTFWSGSIRGSESTPTWSTSSTSGTRSTSTWTPPAGSPSPPLSTTSAAPGSVSLTRRRRDGLSPGWRRTWSRWNMRRGEGPVTQDAVVGLDMIWFFLNSDLRFCKTRIQLLTRVLTHKTWKLNKNNFFFKNLRTSNVKNKRYKH